MSQDIYCCLVFEDGFDLGSVILRVDISVKGGLAGFNILNSFSRSGSDWAAQADST